MDETDKAERGSSAPASPLPSPTLPKGGGAIRDIGEKFSANPATGSGALSVPVFTTTGRGGFRPDLALRYDTGKGNGPYGIGWSLSVPRITRKTDKGLPQYADARDSDTFILSGAEDLVPALKEASGQWSRDQYVGTDETGVPHDVLRFKPRVESAYARIERWRRQADGDIHWRAITKDNIRSIYGRSPSARIADPSEPAHVFSWLLEETRDGKGNVIAYEYKPEDQQNINPTVGIEHTRPIANAYLKRIYYGNQTPDVASNWHFQVLFDYGEHDQHNPFAAPTVVWPGRQDPFSDFRSTFEIRTHRLCRRILMLHNFPELAPDWTVVRSTELTYEETPIATYLRAVRHRGWLLQPDSTYDDSLVLPAIALDYSRATIEPTIHTVAPEDLANLPMGIDGKSYQLLDLDGEGLPGIFSEQADAFFYKHNDGDGHFAPVRCIAKKPSIANLQQGLQQITDVDGSGDKFLVQLGREPQGFYRRSARGWNDFHPFRSIPNLDWQDPELHFLDIDGDGLPDVLKPEAELLRWWPSWGRDGYGPERRVTQSRDDRQSPTVVWSDPERLIAIADMTGDGLSDIVRIGNGSVEYWPNRGYGRFGAKVTMRNAPRFAADDSFNTSQIRIADVDGSGTADLLYVDAHGAHVSMNQCGNGFSDAQSVGIPSIAGATVSVGDLLGKGTACLVWSTPLPSNHGQQMQYVDLMGGIKPHLLVSIDNNLGARTTIEYLPSTKFHLADRKAGLPWVTKLPFPMHVVSRVEVDESVTGTKMVSTYRYHHGHYDGIEREFAGFGMVEQDDAETLTEGATSITYTPPKRTKTWFDNGAWFKTGPLVEQYRREFDSDFSQLVPASIMPSGVPADEARQAARALCGRVLRQEVYGLDGSPQEGKPYAVTESRFEVRRIQPQADNRYAAFDVIPRETLTAHTERNPADPRLEHGLTLAVDDFGNVQESLHIAYARKSATDGPQAQTLITYKQADYVTLTEGVDYYRVDLVRETRTYELSGLAAPATDGVYALPEVAALLPTTEVDFTETPTTPSRRLFERTRQTFLGDTPLDNPTLALGLVTQTRRAAATPALAALVYGSLAANPKQLFSDGKYDVTSDPSVWWAPSGVAEYDVVSFYLPKQFTDPFGNVSAIGYDSYALLPKSATSAVGTVYSITTTVASDYRTLAPALLTDGNGNRTKVASDALGRVTGSWVMGKTTESTGDDDAHPSTRFEYHLEVVPAYVYVEKREEHWYTDRTNTKLQRAYSYSDGLGREVLTKKQAQTDASGAAGWTGTGRVVYDNKGNPVQKYEPYFSTTPGYEPVSAGFFELLHYDPLNRVVRTDHPNGSYARAEFDAWSQTTFDENDTVGEPGNAWYQRYSTGSADQQDAAKKALAHSDTPTHMQVDPLGRTYFTEQDNGVDASGNPQRYPTTLKLDIQGNQRVVNDARKLDVAKSIFDMLGHALQVASVDAGTKTVLVDATGAVVHEWNPNAIEVGHEYDPLRRPTRAWVIEMGTKRLAERTFYGETLADGAAHNVRGRVYCQLDGAGLITHEYDFKGNVVSTMRQLANSYDAQPSWPDVAEPSAFGASLGASGLDAETFATTTAYDALNRVTRVHIPSGTTAADHVALPAYNETGLLGAMSVQLYGAAATPLVTAIDYNEKEQRLHIAYGNGVATDYTYEPGTFRLSTLKTMRGSVPLQALSYTYDPVGNITTVEDDAQQTLFVGNSIVKPRTTYNYDAIYRLIYALGREHAGQAVMPDQTFTPDGVPIP